MGLGEETGGAILSFAVFSDILVEIEDDIIDMKSKIDLGFHCALLASQAVPSSQ